MYHTKPDKTLGTGKKLVIFYLDKIVRAIENNSKQRRMITPSARVLYVSNVAEVML